MVLSISRKAAARC